MFFRLFIVFIFSILITCTGSALAQLDDGTYDAEVTTSSGTYTVPVEVEDGEVTHVEWPNGGDMTVNGAELDSYGSASGYNSRGDNIDIEIDR